MNETIVVTHPNQFICLNCIRHLIIGDAQWMDDSTWEKGIHLARCGGLMGDEFCWEGKFLMEKE